MNRDELQAAYDDAGSISELARRLDLAYQTARYRLRKEGVTTADSRVKDPYTGVEWQRMYDAARSLSALARELGMSNGLVRYYLLKHGITPRTSGYRSPKSRTYRGAAHPNWKGGTYRHSNGYIYEYAPDHPNAPRAKGYVLQHRLVMERALGRLLDDRELVHHRNEVKDDNRIENLEVTSRSGHMRGHKAGRPRDANGRFA